MDMKSFIRRSNRTASAGLAGALLISGTALAAPADLSTWSKKGPAGNGTWTVQSSGGVASTDVV
jgi:hypothetical protein